MSNNKQNSVQWLSNHAYELFEQYSEGNFDRINLNNLMLKATEQAKLMHEEEIENAYKNGWDAGVFGSDCWEEIYYYKTFGGNNEQ